MPISGDVFADLELPEAEDLSLRSGPVIASRRPMEARKLTQAEISKLLRGNLRRCMAEQLMRMLTALDRDIEIAVRPHAKAGEGGRIVLHPGTT